MVVIAAPPDHEPELERIAGAIAGRPDEAGGFHPIVITGGETRAESVGLALAEVPAQAPASSSTTRPGRWRRRRWSTRWSSASLRIRARRA